MMVTCDDDQFSCMSVVHDECPGDDEPLCPADAEGGGDPGGVLGDDECRWTLRDHPPSMWSHPLLRSKEDPRVPPPRKRKGTEVDRILKATASIFESLAHGTRFEPYFRCNLFRYVRLLLEKEYPLPPEEELPDSEETLITYDQREQFSTARLGETDASATGSVLDHALYAAVSLVSTAERTLKKSSLHSGVSAGDVQSFLRTHALALQLQTRDIPLMVSAVVVYLAMLPLETQEERFEFLDRLNQRLGPLIKKRPPAPRRAVEKKAAEETPRSLTGLVQQGIFRVKTGPGKGRNSATLKKRTLLKYLRDLKVDTTVLARKETPGETLCEALKNALRSAGQLVEEEGM